MPDMLTRLLDGLKKPLKEGLRPIRRGIEREALRVDAEGCIAQTPHPEALGNKLTHPWITTDYAESLMELVTPVCDSVPEVIAFLTDLHHHVLRHLPKGEWLWPASMPARLPQGGDSVRIADFGESHSGRLKHVYRKGLRHRYGSIMQSIAGIHYNFSLTAELWQVLQQLENAEDRPFDQYRTERYFHLIRQFRRNSWLLLYLFGASTAVDDSFFTGMTVPEGLVRYGQHTWLSPHATSLRMSDIGYQNHVQGQLKICFNRLNSYIRTLKQGIEIPWPPYEKIGVKVDGEWQQLSSHILQIENEYYSDIRPKRVAQRGQTQLQALYDQGVEYIEVRCLDINPQLPLGIDETQIRFLDIFLTWCLLSPGELIGEEECERLDDNRSRVATSGRVQEGVLSIEGRMVTLSEHATLLFDQLSAVAACLDAGEEGEPHQRALDTLRVRLSDPSQTASGQAANALATAEKDLTDVAMQLARQHASALRSHSLSDDMQQRLEEKRQQSIADERALVEQDEGSFEDYVEHYLASARHVS